MKRVPIARDEYPEGCQYSSPKVIGAGSLITLKILK